MQAVQDPVYSQVPGIFTMGDESATLSQTTQQGVQAVFRKVVTTVALTAARTLTLPSAAAAGFGTEIVVNDVFGAINGANTISIARAGSDTINGGTGSLVLSGAGNRVTLTSDGVSKWTGSVGGGSAAVSSTQAKVTTNATVGATTAAAGDLTGAADVTAIYTGVTNGGAAALTTRTAAQMIADSGLQVGQSFVLLLVNGNAGGIMTLTGGTGVTISGTATLAASTSRKYVGKVLTATTMSFTNCASTGSYS
jgi:hypothetical protein